MNKELLRLFNAVHTESRDNVIMPVNISEKSIKNGYILDPRIKINDDLLKDIKDVIGISGIKANNAFHKSWKIIKESSFEELKLQQIVHYITTYGFEKLGVFKHNTVYIPNEVLELPEITDKIPLTVIKAMTKIEIQESIIKLDSSEIALSKTVLNDIMTIIENLPFSSSKFVHNLKNRELKVQCYNFYQICPSEPIEYLRFVISKLTNESLLIKNGYLISSIKEANGKFLDTLLEKAPDDLASIFFRYKPLFLALKSISRNKTFFNKLRKSARTLHKPLGVDYLNDITNQIKKGQLDLEALSNKLKTTTIFRKIRLLYALSYRMNKTANSIVYKVRNGSGWVDDFKWSGNHYKTKDAYNIVLKSITESMKNKVKGNTYFIPKSVNYTLPATEKQFTGNLPNGSYVTVPEDLIAGIHWYNTENLRVDLDLSTLDLNGKIGWDRDYTSEGGDILFSGDITNAPRPNGATELFYLKANIVNPQLLLVNYYNYEANEPVETKIIAAHEKTSKFGNNYMVDVNNIVASANIVIDKKETIIGLLCSVNKENRLYFSKISTSRGISSSGSEIANKTRSYLFNSLTTAVALKEVLIKAGAILIDEKPEEGEYIDLSPEALDKTTIIDLLIKK